MKNPEINLEGIQQITYKGTTTVTTTTAVTLSQSLIMWFLFNKVNSVLLGPWL